MKILVAGGAGYIGSHVVKLLQSTDHEITIFDNLSTGHDDAIPKKLLTVGDLSNINAIDACFQKNKFDVVMHFASSIVVGESVVDPAKYYRNNVVNTINLLDVMQKYKVKNIIFSSSAAVYGDPTEIPITTKHPRNPNNPYGKSKAMVEQIIEDYHHAYELQYCFLRYFNAAGADPSGAIGEKHDPETHLIPLALQVALGKKKSLDVYGTDYDTPDGTCIRDYVHVCDIANAHLLAMNYLLQEKKSASFNLGTHKGNSVKEVIDAVEKITGKKLQLNFLNRRAGDAAYLVADNTKAREQLHWQLWYPSLEKIITDAWNFYVHK